MLIYLIQLVAALPIGVQVFQVIEASIGNSLSLEIIEEGFNRTVFEDFLNSHGASITPLIGLLRWIVPMYLLLSVFLHSGIFYSLINKKNDIGSFMNGAVKIFIPFLKLSLFFLFLMLVWTAIIWITFFMLIGNPIEDPSSEKVLVFWGLITILIYLLGLAMLTVWSIFSKINRVKQSDTMVTALQRGFKFWMSSWFSSLFITIGYVALHLLLMGIYYFISEPIGASKLWLILILIAIQQVVVMIKIGLRIGLYESLNLFQLG